MKKFWIITLVICLLLWGCGKHSSSETTATPSPTDPPPATIPEIADMFTDRDLRTEYDSTPVSITLKGDSASGGNSNVKVNGSTVTITGEGTYVLSGCLEGMVIVDADKAHKLQLVLDNATITSPTSAAIYIKQADKVFITLADGSVNTLTGAESFVAIDDNNIDAALFSKDDVTLNGNGSLTITCPAGHGIAGKDDLVITGGNYTVNCAGHGLDANDSVRITDAALHITAGKDGIHAENTDDASLGYVYLEKSTFAISAEGDGISATTTMQIAGGSFAITTGGGAENGTKQSSDNYGGFMGGPGGGRPGGMGGFPQTTTNDTDSASIKGLKAGADLVILEGDFQLDCADDGIHSNANLTVHTGTFSIATGDDGMHADENLQILGGNLTVRESYEGLEGLDISISGGDIRLTCSDDGINAAGGTDSSGFGGGRGDQFGGRPGGMGGRPGMGGKPGMGGMGGTSNGSITISGGSIYMNASGDGIDANGSLTISGGLVTVCGPTRGDTAVLDYDISATITGGTFIGTGASNMAQSFTQAEQGILALYTGSCIAGTQITVTDSSSNIILNYAPALDYELLILSTPDMVKGESYTVTISGESYSFEAE